MFSSHIETE